MPRLVIAKVHKTGACEALIVDYIQSECDRYRRMTLTASFAFWRGKSILDFLDLKTINKKEWENTREKKELVDVNKIVNYLKDWVEEEEEEDEPVGPEEDHEKN